MDGMSRGPTHGRGRDQHGARPRLARLTVLGRASFAACLLACSSDAPTIPISERDCDDAGPVHDGSVLTATWRAADSPHFIRDTVRVAQLLTIEAGALVCAHPAAAVLIAGSSAADTAQLRAVGAASSSITFRAVVPEQPWAGIVAGSSVGAGYVTMRFVDVASANHLTTTEYGRIDVEASHFHRVGVSFSGALRLSVVDTADVVVVSPGVFEDNLIRAGTLVVTPGPSGGPIAVNGGRIENSPTGLRVGTRYLRPPPVTSSRPLRIVGSVGIPLIAPIGTFQSLWPTRSDQDSLLGNVNDTIVIRSDAPPPGRIDLRRGLSWLLTASEAGYPPIFQADTLTIEAGAQVALAVFELHINGRITARGTAEAPIRISSASSLYGVRIVLSATALQALEHVLLDNVQVCTGCGVDW